VLPEPTTTLELPDGRVLACDDVGARDGSPVVYLHGAPDCRLARHPDDRLAADAGIRLVAVDRPGYGWSDPPAPDLLTFGDELGLLLDHLGIDSCAVAAWSAGVPWAFGTGAALGDRVTRIVTYGAVAPLEAFTDGAVAAGSGPRADIAADVLRGETTADEVADELAMLLVPSPPVPIEQARDQVVETVAPSSLEALEAEGLVEALAWSLAAAVDRHADAGLRCDVVVQFRPGVADVLGQVRCPVVLVHGEDDRIAGPAVGHWLAGRLADATVEVWPGAGHDGLLLDWRRFLALAR
jgi:pimeloyl-ACP methyl ester carboxylesterase